MQQDNKSCHKVLLILVKHKIADLHFNLLHPFLVVQDYQSLISSIIHLQIYNCLNIQIQRHHNLQCARRIEHALFI